MKKERNTTIQTVYCASIIIKTFKELYDLDNKKYYSIKEFSNKVTHTHLYDSLISVYGNFSINDYKDIIMGLNKGCLLHKRVSDNKYQFWNIQGGGLLDK